MAAKPEIEQLMRSVEKRYGSMLNTTTDFEVFSLQLKRSTGHELSASTLKRIWGYVNDNHQPRLTTLDILAQYAGHASYADFKLWLKRQCPENSEFINIEQIISSDLSVGDSVRIGWSPDRMLLLSYLGNNGFEVIEAENSKVIVGDRFEVGCIIKHQPLLLPYILRQGQRTPPFLAGRDGGITVLATLPK